MSPFTWISILLFLPVSIGETGSLQCPSSVQVELGTNGVIACNISFEFKNLYWYKGESFSDYPPIIRYQDGVPEKGDEFETTPDGALVILNTDINREGIYTVVVFRLNTLHEYASVILTTFAYPKPLFPIIQLCNGTQRCQLRADTGGSVQCVLHGARPAFELGLKSNGIQLANITQWNVTNASTGLTNTFIKANYQSLECLQVSNITCIATGVEMQELMSTVVFHDDCDSITPADATGKGSGGVAVAITLVLVVIVVVVVAVIVYFKRFSVNRRENNQERTGIVYLPVGQSEDKVIDTNSQTTTTEKNQEKDVGEDDKTKLLEALSEKYRAGYFGSLSNDRIISIDDVYIDLEFEIKDDKDETTTVDINQLLMQPYINDKKNRVFLSNKMQLTFSSYFAYLWSTQAAKENILLFFNMKSMSEDADIVTVIKQILQDKLPITEDAVIKVIETFGCHIILEEVNFRHFFSKTENSKSSEPFASGNKGSPFKWTIGNILRDLERKSIPKNVFQWIIVYDLDTFSGPSYTPYQLVNIKEITEFIFAHFDRYIDSVVEYYCRNEEQKDYRKMVKEVMLQYDLQKKFQRARLLLMQMVHLVTKMCFKNDEKLKTEGITSLIIKSLYFLKMRYLKKLSLHDSDTLVPLEENLGRVAFNQIDGKGNVEQSLSEDEMKFCKSVGIITQSSCASRIMFTTELVKWFVTASFLQDEKTFSRFLERAVPSEDNAESKERLNVLPFTCALQSSYAHVICERLLKEGKMDDFLDCFYESTNSDDFHGVIKKYLEKESHPVTITYNKYHIVKIRCLLKYCKNWKITVSRIRFQKVSQTKSDVSFVKADEFEMPPAERVTFCKISLNEEDTFMYYLKWIMGLNVKSVRFDDCTLPEFTNGLKLDLQRIFSQTESKVHITTRESDGITITEKVLNKKKIKWDKGTTKAIKNREQEVRPYLTKGDEGYIANPDCREIHTEDEKGTAPDKPPRKSFAENILNNDQSPSETDAQSMEERLCNVGNKNGVDEEESTAKDQTREKNESHNIRAIEGNLKDETNTEQHKLGFNADPVGVEQHFDETKRSESEMKENDGNVTRDESPERENFETFLPV